ncbi:MAG: hypothetical protein GY816_05810 [Cytophagales bacterium]|nr:hypothetical protein [Cytophagales bacterium]
MSWKNKSIRAKDVAHLYNEFEGEWLLLDLLQRSKDGKAEEFVLIAHSKEKDELYDFVMEEGGEIDGNFIFVFAHPNGICEI